MEGRQGNDGPAKRRQMTKRLEMWIHFSKVELVVLCRKGSATTATVRSREY
jgi:hypothetical protein